MVDIVWRSVHKGEMIESDYIFREAKAEPGAPLLLLFHGTGGDENQFFDLGRQLLPEARIVAPRGDVSENGAPRYFKRLAMGQYDMADLDRAVAKMASFVAAHAGDGDPSEVVALGYSNGANIIAATQFEHPALFDRAVLLHPLIPFAPKDQPGLAGKAVLITAGRRDPICPPPATEALAEWYRGRGAEVTLFWHEGGHEIRQDELSAVQLFLR